MSTPASNPLAASLGEQPSKLAACSSFTLPFPPSLNGLFKNARKGRVKTLAYRTWIDAAGWELVSQRPAPVSGRYLLTLNLHAPDNRARDLDNLCKAVSDLLVTHAVIQADHLAKRIVLEWSDAAPSKPGALSVTVEPYAPPVAVARAA